MGDNKRAPWPIPIEKTFAVSAMPPPSAGSTDPMVPRACDREVKDHRFGWGCLVDQGEAVSES
ncbi:hypothetical protein, partial [Glycomyces tenuis]|uniref:hypothetical protein n=1 Tax=Glycomyces tenuis TaxID=58116 RepID=UPI001B8045FA